MPSAHKHGELPSMATQNPNNPSGLQETDAQETQEWLDALTAVIENEGLLM